MGKKEEVMSPKQSKTQQGKFYLIPSLETSLFDLMPCPLQPTGSTSIGLLGRGSPPQDSRQFHSQGSTGSPSHRVLQDRPTPKSAVRGHLANENQGSDPDGL